MSLNLRRSQRLSSKKNSVVCLKPPLKNRKCVNSREHNKKQNLKVMLELTKLGSFDLLPLEAIFEILHNIPVLELSNMTMSSKNMRDLINFYVTSIAGAKRLMLDLKPDFKDNSVCNHNKNVKSFQVLGILLKRMTFLYPTKQRIQIILEVIKKVSMTSVFPFKSRYLKCFGQMAQTIIAGWAKPECRFANDSLINISGIDKFLSHVLHSAPGSNPLQEKKVRNFFRFIYLDLCKNSECGFWLTTILKPYPYVHQAKLLFIIFGPYDGKKIQWVSDETPLASNGMKKDFYDLASALQILLKENDWNPDGVLSLMKELTNTPFKWPWDVTACFFHTCGADILLLVMTNLLVNGRILGLSNLIASSVMVCDKLGCDMKELVNIVAKLCKIKNCKKDAVTFLKVLAVILLNNNEDINEFSEDLVLYDFEDAQKKFFTLIMLKAFDVKDDSHSKLYEE